MHSLYRPVAELMEQVAADVVLPRYQNLAEDEISEKAADDFVTIAELEAARAAGQPEGEEGRWDFQAIDEFVVDTSAALDCLPQVNVTDEAATKIRLGNPVIVRGRDAPLEAEEACALSRGRLVAIGAIEQGMFKPKRVFTA